MLEIGKANEVKFKVSVNGTSAQPSVRLVIGTPDAELGFPAEKSLDGGDMWFSEVFVPEDLAPGDYDFRVEAVINNRIFTPIKRKVVISRSPDLRAASNPTPEPEQTFTAPVTPTPVPPPAARPTIPASLVREAAKKAEARKEVKKNAEPVKEVKKNAEPVKKVAEPVKEVNKVQKKEKAPIRIKMSDIVAESNERFEKDLAESPTYKKPGMAAVKPTHIIQPNTPVTLKKGEVVYE